MVVVGEVEGVVRGLEEVVEVLRVVEVDLIVVDVDVGLDVVDVMDLVEVVMEVVVAAEVRERAASRGRREEMRIRIVLVVDGFGGEDGKGDIHETRSRIRQGDERKKLRLYQCICTHTTLDIPEGHHHTKAPLFQADPR